MEVVRKAIVVGKCCSMCRTHLQIFSVSTVLGEKASDVVQKADCSWPSPSTTVDRKRTSKRRHHVRSVERFALSFSFSFSRSVHGCLGMDV